ncbi:MAG: carboxypeptidase-like regulatory domain-containing protein [Bacteroidales bacterium]|nr:carboxypeptidase-like regulatory domain-containing protein [Bacteroidales bacterium]
MRKYIYTLIILQFFNFISSAQEIEMSGTIIDAQTNTPIEFVNIGVFNKSKGTVSNQNGKFNISLPYSFLGDSLTISHVSYETVKIPIKNSKNLVVALQPKANELSEVVVTNKEKKTTKTGVKSYSRLLSMRVISKSSDIIEVAQRINIPNKEVKIKAINIAIRKWSEIGGAKVRINFYEDVDNTPGKRIVFKNIVSRIITQDKSDWIHIDVNDRDIYLSKDFFVGIEFIPNFKKPTLVDLGAILTKGKGYKRENSLGSWKKLNGAASINIELEY